MMESDDEVYDDTQICLFAVALSVQIKVIDIPKYII